MLPRYKQTYKRREKGRNTGDQQQYVDCCSWSQVINWPWQVMLI